MKTQMNAAEKSRQFHKRYQSNGPRVFGIVESGIHYSYHRNTAASFAVWAKEKKSRGESMLFKDFMDQLSRDERDEIRFKPYSGEQL
jgi:hypothetical protein